MIKVELIRGSCADQTADVVVNAANCYLAAGGGICGVIFKKAGYAELTEACNKCKRPLEDGDAVLTPSFGLTNAKAIIHAVGPDFRNKDALLENLTKAYYNSLVVMKDNSYHSISFPLISSGIFGESLKEPAVTSAKKCLAAVRSFVATYPDYDADVKLCAFTQPEYDTVSKAFYGAKEFEVYVSENDFMSQILGSKSSDKEIKHRVVDENGQKYIVDVNNNAEEKKRETFRKSTPADRVAVFQDTQDWCAMDPDLIASIQKAKQATEIFYEDNYPAFNASTVERQTVTVTGERSFEAAMRLYKEKPGSKIAVMNFANAFHPGGGVVKGASAQEECLCRTSTLYPLLYRNSLREFYNYHKNKNTPKASDSLIYTEGVVICKTDEEFPKRLPKEDWVTVDVITIAAPDLRDKSNQYAPVVGGGTYMNDAELFGYHVKRAIHMLTVAAYKGADTLVLGAFGCGAFQNNPEVVARAYKIALAEFPEVFDRVVFAVLCNPGQISKNYSVFSRIF